MVWDVCVCAADHHCADSKERGASAHTRLKDCCHFDHVISTTLSVLNTVCSLCVCLILLYITNPEGTCSYVCQINFVSVIKLYYQSYSHSFTIQEKQR